MLILSGGRRRGRAEEGEERDVELTDHRILRLNSFDLSSSTDVFSFESFIISYSFHPPTHGHRTRSKPASRGRRASIVGLLLHPFSFLPFLPASFPFAFLGPPQEIGLIGHTLGLRKYWVDYCHLNSLVWMGGSRGFGKNKKLDKRMKLGEVSRQFFFLTCRWRERSCRWSSDRH